MALGRSLVMHFSPSTAIKWNYDSSRIRGTVRFQDALASDNVPVGARIYVLGYFRILVN